MLDLPLWKSQVSRPHRNDGQSCSRNLNSWEAVFQRYNRQHTLMCRHFCVSVIYSELIRRFAVMDMPPQTPKYRHNLTCASFVVTFGSLWCRRHDVQLGMNSFSNVSWVSQCNMATTRFNAILLIVIKIQCTSLKASKLVWSRLLRD